MRNILLIEPNYKNKYPPIGLMKIAMYHRELGDNVTFFKGDLKKFVVDLITKKCIHKLYQIDKTINWNMFYNSIKKYIERGKQLDLEYIKSEKSTYESLLLFALNDYRKFYQKKNTKKNRYSTVFMWRLYLLFTGK